MNDHAHLVDRLRSLGTAPVDPGIEGRVVARMASDGGRTRPGFVRRSLRVAPAAVLLVVAVPAAAAVITAMPDEVPAEIVPLDGEEGSEGLACTGQPPFAGQPPEGEGAERGEARRAEAREHATFRSEECPDTDADSDADGEACTGAPPFAGEPAEPAEGDGTPSARASEARDHAEARQGCHGNGNGPPDGVPAGPPTDVPAGPPTDVPAGPASHAPAG